MAAAALLRSVARRIARVPTTPHTRPLLARGLHGSARPGAGGSLPPQIRNEIQDGGGNRLVAGMAAAGLPSQVSKIACAPQHRHLHLDNASHNQSSLPPAAKLAYFAVFVSAGLLYFWVEPTFRELKHRRDALRIERDILIQTMEECHRKCTDVLAGPSPAQRLQALEHCKETDGAIDNGSSVHSFEELG